MPNDMNTNVIPQGDYCYARGADGEHVQCPYWQAETERNAYCAFLEKDDNTIRATRGKKGSVWWDGLSLIWDEVKECGENRKDENGEYHGGENTTHYWDRVSRQEYKDWS